MMQVHEIIKRFEKSKAPIDPFEVARNLNISVQENLNLKNISNITMQLHQSCDQPCIWVNPHLTEQYRNYFFAGELGALLNGQGGYESDDCVRPILEGVCKHEKFACDLLLPVQSVKNEIQNILSRQMGQMLEVKYLTPLLAEKFIVPNFVIVKRLKYLGLTTGAKEDVIHEFQLN